MRFFVALMVSTATTVVLQILFYCNLIPLLEQFAGHIDFILIIQTEFDNFLCKNKVNNKFKFCYRMCSWMASPI